MPDLGLGLPETAWIRAKLLIFLSLQPCCQKEHCLPGPAKSSTWQLSTQVAHKVIHTFRGQLEKSFSIMHLPHFLEVEPGIRVQVHGLRP
jgi:hypothetical protein